MKNVLVFCSLLVSTSVFANIIPDLTGPALRDMYRGRLTSGCTDFSGEWKGKCTGGADAGEASVSIEQHGCEILSLNKSVMIIGAASSGSMGIPAIGSLSQGAFANTTFTLNWNEPKNALVATMGGMVQKLGEANGASYFGAGGFIRLSGAQLVSEFKVQDKTFACVMDKK